jgi:hypothetical protein
MCAVLFQELKAADISRPLVTEQQWLRQRAALSLDTSAIKHYNIEVT